MQFWRDNLARTFAGTPPKEPVAILLHHALQTLRDRYPGISHSAMKSWCLRVVNAREKYMDGRPYIDMESLERYSEDTYSSLIYATLAALPLHSMPVDHLASHIGKATGIVAVLRGLPILAFPGPHNHHNSNSVAGVAPGTGSKQGVVVLPLDIMAKAGVRQEDVLRKGAEADGLRDAVFEVATRANDHLITAREMLKNLKAGEDAGHAFEYEGEEGHDYDPKGGKRTESEDLERGFGALMPAVSTRLWLNRLEKLDFDVFRPELREREWTLPFKSYWAFSKRIL